MQDMESSLITNVFPQKLWLLVNNSNIHSIVWNDQGEEIIINKNLFEKEFLCLNVFRKSSGILVKWMSEQWWGFQWQPLRNTVILTTLWN